MTMGGIALTDYVALESAKGSDLAQPETELCARLRRGDLAAVGEAYDSYHLHVRAFARRLLGDADATEDLVQEVFVTLPAAIRRYRADASLKTFILSIAVNHSRHHIRAAMRRRKAMQSLAGDCEREVSGGDRHDPELLAGQKQLAQLLQRALDDLPLDQRIAFVLCEVEERPSPEVARIVGAPEATVRTRLFHARKKLRTYLETRGVTT